MVARGPTEVVDASGPWRVHPAERDLHRRFPEPGFDDRGWLEAPVPGHWRSVPELADHDGPVLYRRRIDAERPRPGRRRFLVLDGVFYHADTWFDGRYLGASEGYFEPRAHEISAPSRETEEHVVAVEVSCPPQPDPTAKSLLTGVFSHWDCLDERWNPGGLWRPVRVVETGPVRLARMQAVCVEATEERGRIRLALLLDAGPDPTDPSDDDGPRPVRLRARLAGAGIDVEQVREERLAAGANHLDWTLEVDRPPLWWPRHLGSQPLVDLEVTVEAGGEPSDRATARTAFREVRLDDWILHVNGERLFVRGSNHAPTRMALGEATADEVRRDVDLALAANLDMLRVHAHVGRPELYEAADERGLLLWQDLPLQWGYARTVRKEAVRQARGMVDLLGHHPSVVLWCGHNEPLAVDVPTGEPPSPRVVARVGASMLAPTWNKTVLDRSIRRALRSADPSRPVVQHSGVLPGPASGGTDSHLYFGWYYGHMADLADALRAWPRLARFVSELGAQAVPERADFVDASAWPDLDWEHLRERHACQKHYFDRHVPPSEHPDFESWAEATRAYQAALVQLQVEDLRRLKYRPTGGFLQFCFADALPAITWSLLDAERRPKRGYGALRRACRPVLPMLDPRSGDLHVVSERRERLEGAEVEVETGPRGGAAGAGRRRWSGDVEADGVTLVGNLGGPVEADLVTLALRHPALTGDGDPDGGHAGEVVNEYGPLLLHRVRERSRARS